jgi:hypothetical protein
VERASTGSAEDTALDLVLKPSVGLRATSDLIGVVVIAALAANMVNGFRLATIDLLLIGSTAAGVVAINRMALSVSHDRIASCGGFRTRFWSREEIGRFEVSRLPGSYGLIDAVVAHGKPVPLRATRLLVSRREAEATAAKLNEWLGRGHHHLPTAVAPPSGVEGHRLTTREKWFERRPPPRLIPGDRRNVYPKKHETFVPHVGHPYGTGHERNAPCPCGSGKK